MSVPMEVLISLVKLGRDFEKAYHGGEPLKAGPIEKKIDALCGQYPEEWLTPIVCRGQNIYRKAHGMEEAFPLD